MLKQLTALFPRKEKVPQETKEEFYRMVFENSQDGILLTDADTGVIFEVNSFLYQLLGYEEFIGKEVWRVGLLAGIVPNREAFDELRKGKSVRYDNLPMQTKDGQMMRITFISNYYETDGRKIVQLDIREFTQSKAVSDTLKQQNILLENAQKSMIQMIEDLDQAKKEIEREKVKADALVLSIGDGVIAVDPWGRITVVNEAARRMLLWDFRQVYGKQISETLVMEDDQDRPVGLREISENSREIRMTRGDRTKFPVYINVKPIVWADKVIGTVIVFRDVTKEKEIERVKSEFISIATHQLKTPITGMKWSLQLLNIPEEQLSDDQKTHLKNIKNFIDVLGNTVSDLLNVSRIELGTQLVETQKLNLSEFLNKFLEEIKPYAESLKHNIIVTGTDQVQVDLNADPKLLRGIFQNLVSNAIEYSDAGRDVGINIERQGDSVKVSVINQGVGISEAARPHIFQKFYRAVEAKKVKESGTGMGLYIVKLFVEKMGGRVGFESEGNKTVFWFQLPVG